MPTISVLIPCYNEALYIWTAVKSVLRQSFHDWELIIVDDGSIDATPAALDKILRRCSQQSVMTSWQSHCGCAAATKHAIALATSPLCTILDGDDELEVDSLKTIVEFFQDHPEIGYAWSRYRARVENGGKWKEGRSKPLPEGKNLKEALLSGWWGALAQRSFRKEAYARTSGIDGSLPFAVDQQLAMLFANAGVPAVHIPTVTYLHLQHSQQMSAHHYKDQQRCRGEILKRLGGKYVRER